MRDCRGRRPGVILTGGADAVTALAGHLLTLPHPLELVPLDGMPLDDVPDRLRADATCAGVALPRLARPADLAGASIVVLADVPERSTPLALRAATRLADELALKAPDAWLLVAASADHLLVRAAAVRLGRRVLGVGAFAEAEALATRLARALDVFRGDVSATVLGGGGARRVVPRGMLRVAGIPAAELLEPRALERLLAAPSAPLPPSMASAGRWLARTCRAIASGRQDAILAHFQHPDGRYGTALLVPEAAGPRHVRVPLAPEETAALDASLAAIEADCRAYGIR